MFSLLIIRKHMEVFLVIYRGVNYKIYSYYNYILMNNSYWSKFFENSRYLECIFLFSQTFMGIVMYVQ